MTAPTDEQIAEHPYLAEVSTTINALVRLKDHIHEAEGDSGETRPRAPRELSTRELEAAAWKFINTSVVVDELPDGEVDLPGTDYLIDVIAIHEAKIPQQ